MTDNIKEHPILFSGEMVRAILEGRKTMTRRVLKPQPQENSDTSYGKLWWNGSHGWDERQLCLKCTYGQAGDRLWVRETWQNDEYGIYFKATDKGHVNWGWKPSIHMPRKYSRINLEITGIRVERLQDITGPDAFAEGIQLKGIMPESLTIQWDMARWNFRTLWDTLNGKRGYGWEINPWVWVIEFKRNSGGQS